MWTRTCYANWLLCKYFSSDHSDAPCTLRAGHARTVGDVASELILVDDLGGAAVKLLLLLLLKLPDVCAGKRHGTCQSTRPHSHVPWISPGEHRHVLLCADCQMAAGPCLPARRPRRVPPQRGRRTMRGNSALHCPDAAQPTVMGRIRYHRSARAVLTDS